MKYLKMRNFFVIFLALLSYSLRSAADNFNEVNGVTIDVGYDAYDGMDRGAIEHLEYHPYFIPNEPIPLIYMDVIAQKRGTLISVGTFRTLVTFSIGGFDRLIMFDVSGPLVKFNRQHLQFIKELATSGSTVASQRAEYIKKYRRYLTNIPPEEGAKSYGDDGFAGWNTLTQYYWNNDILWKKITDALLKGNIKVIRGNLGSAEVNAELVNALAKNKTPITIDASNVRQYVVDDNFYEALKEFEKVSSDRQISVMATTFLGGSELDKDFLLGKDEYDTHYYYFPSLSDWVSLKPKVQEPSSKRAKLEMK